MKKLVSILLALALILALSTTAFATEDTTLTVADGRTYAGYQLLNLTTSLKDGDTCNDGHDEDCYNYAYTVNSKYLTVLQNASGKATEKDILDYLASLTDADDMRSFADDLYTKITAANLVADETALTGSDTISQGYWLFADVTNLGGANKANSLVIVDTKGQDAFTINPKTGLPTIEKKVKDTNDSTAETSNWQDSADHDIGDTVPFQITVGMPENLAGYDTYKIVIHDTMSAGLTLDASSIKVSVGETDVTTSFEIPEADQTGDFTISCDNVLAIADLTVTKDTKFVVTYDATLNNSAVIGEAGNPNEVYLEFSNNPYTNGTGKTEPDKVIVFTYKVIINKTDAANKPLAGAGFKLYKKNAQGTYDLIGTELKGADMVQFVWNGLDDGDYKLEESTVPAGYNKMADLEFTITAEHSETAAEPALTSLDGGNLATGEVSTGVITKDIINRTGSVLPETGAEGTFFLITGGTLLAMVAVVFMITRKKMSIYED